jgi:hypothetical protein
MALVEAVERFHQAGTVWLRGFIEIQGGLFVGGIL